MQNIPQGDSLSALPRAHGGAVGTGSIRQQPSDFEVDEILGYEATGEGEHVLLSIRKQGLTTQEVLDRLSHLAKVPKRNISYAGLKDKWASTTQAFSVWMPGMRDPDWSQLESEQLHVISAKRHRRKVQIGSLRGNRFGLLIRNAVMDRDSLEQRLQAVADFGVPNYFGEQRFGNGGANLVKARQMFEGGGRVERQLKSILLSSVRAYLFNLVLAERVCQGNWNRPVDGDIMLLAGSQRQFLADAADAAISARMAEFDIDPSGPLCGKPSRCLIPQAACAEIEAAALAGQDSWIEGLQRFGLEADRRALRLKASSLTHEWRQDGLWLSFSLPAGGYATTVLREIVSVDAP